MKKKTQKADGQPGRQAKNEGVCELRRPPVARSVSLRVNTLPICTDTRGEWGYSPLASTAPARISENSFPFWRRER